MNLTDIEARFLEITQLPQEISSFPITELVQFPVRKELSKSHGEVFTPISLVDKMILTSAPQPDKFNLDLCAGRGQFTVRMLRYFTTHNASFDIKSYLTTYHWFNEFNLDSCHELLYIFSEEINLAAGPAQTLESYPEEREVWKRGIFIYEEAEKSWLPSSPSLKIHRKKAIEIF
jgi:hypothetical protein